MEAPPLRFRVKTINGAEIEMSNAQEHDLDQDII